MGALAPVHLSADNSFGVLHRYSSLPLLYENDRRNDRNHQHQKDDHRENSDGPGGQQPEGISDGGGHPGNDSGKDDQGDPVADPALGNLLPQPHDEGRTGGEGDHRHEAEAPARIDYGTHSLQANADSESLNDAQNDRSIPGVLRDFLAPLLPLFL